MSTDSNKSIARSYFAASDADFPDPDAILAPDFISHVPSSDETQNAAQFLKWDKAWRQAVTFEPTAVEDLVVDGDRVAVRVTWRGVHNRGPLMGIAPHGKHIRVSGIAILRIVGDRVAERWLEFDGLSLMRQIQEP